MFSGFRKGFSYIEFLIVILVVTVVSAVVFIVLNPVELLKQSRDSVRLSNIAELSKAINLFEIDSPGGNLGTRLTTYVSIPDPAANPETGSNCDGIGLPGLPNGWAYHCVRPENLRRVDGKGWLPLNFTILPSGPPFATLPVDPVNATSSGLYYAYIPGGSYVLTSSLESPKNLRSQAVNDRGTDDTRYEVGTDFQLWTEASGLKGYWKFENSFLDSSNHGNNGSPYGGTLFAAGKQGLAAIFDGVNDYVEVPYSQFLNPQSFTIAAWANFQGGSGPLSIVNSKRMGTKPLVLGGSTIKRGYFVDVLNNRWRAGIGEADASFETSSWITLFGTAAEVGKWTHLAVTYDGSTLRFYNDGVLVASESASLIVNNQNPLIFGRAESTPYYNFNGFLDEVRIYERALRAQDIAAIYNATK